MIKMVKTQMMQGLFLKIAAQGGGCKSFEILFHPGKRGKKCVYFHWKKSWNIPVRSEAYLLKFQL